MCNCKATVPTIPQIKELELNNEYGVGEELNMPSTSHDPDFEEKDDNPPKLTHSKLSEVILDHLSQDKVELLGSIIIN